MLSQLIQREVSFLTAFISDDNEEQQQRSDVSGVSLSSSPDEHERVTVISSSSRLLCKIDIMSENDPRELVSAL